MRVLFLTHSYPRAAGDAAGSFLLHLAVALREEGIEVRVVAPAAEGVPASESLAGVQVDRFRYAPRRHETLAYTGEMAQAVQRSWSARFALAAFMAAGFARAARVRRDFAPDVVHAHWWFPGGVTGALVARTGGIPLVTTMHGTDVRLARATPMARPLLRHIVRQSRAVTTVSRWLAAEVRDMVPTVEPLVAPMPVSTSLFRPGGARDPRRLLFVGRLNAQKGIALLLEALAAMRSEASLDVVGDGPDAAPLRARAESLGVGGRVAWHGACPQHALPAFYQRAAVLVIPSLGEGLGLVGVEAQLCETPVVAFASGGIPDFVRHGETGLLVPPGDVAALATALDALVDDPARRDALGRAGRQGALATFAPEAAARAYAALYRSVRAS